VLMVNGLSHRRLRSQYLGGTNLAGIVPTADA